ncbi:hypothetical protein J6590_066963 [Homalodisca vitripennis]|nr:hypothetical protein J6590_066963 [Homalodisca vitripennis]
MSNEKLMRRLSALGERRLLIGQQWVYIAVARLQWCPVTVMCVHCGSAVAQEGVGEGQLLPKQLSNCRQTADTGTPCIIGGGGGRCTPLPSYLAARKHYECFNYLITSALVLALSSVIRIHQRPSLSIWSS